MIVTVSILGLVLLLMIGESLIINNCVNSIAVKIHVNGTRGKSTITKYIFAGLKEDHLRVLGKVTGEIPTMLLPDGSQKPSNEEDRQGFRSNSTSFAKQKMKKLMPWF
jgi:hypothetical protein